MFRTRVPAPLCFFALAFACLGVFAPREAAAKDEATPAEWRRSVSSKTPIQEQAD